MAAVLICSTSFPLLLFIACLSFVLSASAVSDDAQALILFKHGISRDPLGLLASWSRDPSRPLCSSGAHSWAGILCDAQQLHVVAVNLRGFNLSGSISSSLAFLPELSLLDLSDNHFSGPLPPSLFDGAHFVSRLQYLNLSFNSLGGNLPDAVGNLSALTQLDLGHNLFEGSLPASIWYLPKLQLLWLESPGSEDPLGASLPVSSFGFCPTIKDLRLKSLALTGQLPPSLGQCKQLNYLVLQDNGLQGIIPQGVWQLPSLRVLYLVETTYAAGLQMEPVPELLTFCPTITQLWLQGFVMISSSMPRQSIPPPSLGDCKQLEFLRIVGINLTGEIPPSLGSCKGLQYLELSHGSLYGAIPATLYNLTHLQGLSFESNFITGGIPVWISNFSELTGLDLGDNPLGGRVPAEIGQLKQLNMLSLFTANLSGPVPKELGNCTQLEWLDFGSSPIYKNQIQGFPQSLARLKNLKTLAWSGDINAPYNVFIQVLANLTLLEYLSPSSSGIYGAISPQVIGDRLSHLNYLDLSFNQIEGSIPPQFGNISLLYSLNLGNNHLEGPLSLQLASLSSHLQYCYLPGNNLSGPIPPWLGRFPKLQILALEANKFEGSIPYEFLASLGASPITNLYLDNNELQGSLPSSIGALKTLVVFSMSNNQLKGGIPPSLGDCSALQDLYMANNYLQGQIPPALGQLVGLRQNLLLSNNSLTGEIPEELGNLVSLKLLDLSRNRLVGHIPRTLQNCTALQTLRLFDNRLTGGVAELDLSRMASLQTFTVQDNSLGGGLPAFTNSTSLVLVDLRNNNFDGEIPAITSSNRPKVGASQIRTLLSLKVLSMASNRITGDIPDWIWDLPSLQLLDLSNNLLTGHMPQTLTHLQYLKGLSSTKINSSSTLYEEVPVILKDSAQIFSYILSSNSLIDLSMNALEGSISESFGELIGLHSLNLSHNRITGNIPPSLSNLSQLESLDVSYNNLCGGLPEGLGALSSLSAFSVSNNHLQGPIPTLSNFDTRFGISSFEGNPNLCGFPLSKKCYAPLPTRNETTLATMRKNRFKTWFNDSISLGGFFVGYPLGVIVGLCFAFLAFKSCKYYRFIGKIVSNIKFY